MRRLAVAVLLALVVALVVGADRAAEQVAENRVAQQIAADVGAAPDVEIAGFPFLTQALRGRYDEMVVSAPRARLRDVPVQDLTATLSGVRVAARDALSGGLDAVPVERLSTTALVAWDDLERAAALPGLQLAPAEDGVRVTGTVSAFGQTLPAVALAGVEVDSAGPGTLVLRVRSVEIGGAAYTGPLPAALGGAGGLRVPVPPLPYDLRLTEARPAERGLVLSGTARDVVLRPRGRAG